MGKAERLLVVATLAMAVSVLNVSFADEPELSEAPAPAISTASSSPSSTDCAGGKTIKVVQPNSPYAKWVPGAHPPGTVFDMSGVTFRLRASSNPDPDGICHYTDADKIPTNSYPVMNPEGNNSGTVDACFRGGRIIGEISPTVDRTVWGSKGGYCNSAAVFMKNGSSTRQKIEAIRVDRVWDAFRMGGANCWKPGLCHNLIRSVWVSNVRDDCVENDKLGGLTIQDSLFDGCYSGISADPGPCKKCTASESHKDTDTIELDGVLLRLQEFPQTLQGKKASNLLAPFKLNGRYAPQFVVNDSIIAFASYDPTRIIRWSTGWERIKSCRNNQLLWLSDAPFPPNPKFPLPPSCFTVKTGAAARAIWNDARAAWIARHSDIARVEGDSPANR
jgi:hypothetical protein